MMRSSFLIEKLVLNINLRDILSFDLEPWKEYIEWNEESLRYFLTEKQYQLMAYLADQLPKGSIIADLGTYTGASAVAFASNDLIKIISYDVRDYAQQVTTKNFKSLSNVEFRLADCSECIDDFIDAKLIHLDINPHNGIQEAKILQSLIEKGFRGLLICDDINLNESMRKFWSDIYLAKVDLTSCGHWSGTGAILFSEDIELRVN